jgi:catecholate siderophore receptor
VRIGGLQGIQGGCSGKNTRAVSLGRRPLCIAMLLALGGAADAASAQGSRGTAASNIDEIEVLGKRQTYRISETSTATKTPTPLIDIPQSLTLISSGMIRDQAMQNMGDVVRYVPGVQMAQGEGHRDAPIFRGNTSTADFFIDGMRDDTQYYRDLYNVEQVEVLKGPSGMIFGRGGSGGLINRVTKQADGMSRRELGATLGSWQNRRLTADIGQAVGDASAFRVSAFYEDSESYRNFAELTRWAINPTFTLERSDTTRVTLGYERFEDERVTDRGIPSQLPSLGLPLETDASTFFGAPDLSPTSATVDALASSVTHEFSDRLSLTNKTRFADYDKFYQNVYPSAYTAADGLVSVSGYNNRTARENLLNQTDVTFSVETGSISHTLLSGMELGRQETDNFRQTAYFTAVGPNALSDFVTLTNPIYKGPVEFRQSATDADNHSIAKNAALYIQDQVELSEHWQAVVGLRYDRFEADLLNNRTAQLLSSTDDFVSPRAGVIYKPKDNVSIYASHTVSYVPRAGEQLASLTASNSTLEPEEFTNNEVGLKWDFGSRLSTTFAVFELDRTNVAIADPNNPTLLMLVDGQRVAGVELGLAGEVTERWQMMAGYAHQDSELRTPGAQSANELGQVPEHSASFWNRYDVSSRLGVGVGIVYRSDVFVATDNAVTLPSLTRLDAVAFYSINDSLRLQFNVENLLDERYYATAHSNNNIMPGSPRTYRVGLTFTL